MVKSIRLAVPTLLVALLLGACSNEESGVTDPDPDPPAHDTVASPPQEGRAVWISRYDWADQGSLVSLIEAAASANFNVIYFQARARSDAYYRSSLEPWADRPPMFVLGRDPGWDPLEVALTTARARGMQLHVWLNALIGWCGSAPPPETTPRHIVLAHPEWQMLRSNGEVGGEGSCTFVTPGIPAVRSHLAAVAADIVRRYQVNGIHLDYIRYPDPSLSYDQPSLSAWEAARVSEPTLSFAEMRRRFVTATVREIHDSLRAARPGAVLSAAVWGVYDQNPQLAAWGTNVAWGYETRFQDSRGWLQQGIMDVIAPMIYWPIQPKYGDRLDFAWLADDFARNSFNRHVYIGMGAPVPDDPSFCQGCDAVRQIYQARRARAQGISLFPGRALRIGELHAAIRNGPFKTRVPVPSMPWR